MTPADQSLLFVGDSLMEYYDWQQRFPSYQVRNLGIGGETVDGLLARQPSIVQGAAPAWLFLMIGTNDLVMENFTFFPAYGAIIAEFARCWPDSRIVVTSLLPMRLPWLAPSAVVRVNERLHQVAQDVAATFLDVHGAFVHANAEGTKDLFLADGVHLSAAGYGLWAAMVADLLAA